MRQKNSVNAYTFVKNGKEFLVVLEQLKNTAYGCPRYKATIVYPSTQEIERGGVVIKPHYNKVYIFNGHYVGDVQEALSILEYSLSQDQNKQ